MFCIAPVDLIHEGGFSLSFLSGKGTLGLSLAFCKPFLGKSLEGGNLFLFMYCVGINTLLGSLGQPGCSGCLCIHFSLDRRDILGRISDGLVELEPVRLNLRVSLQDRGTSLIS